VSKQKSVPVDLTDASRGCMALYKGLGRSVLKVLRTSDQRQY